MCGKGRFSHFNLYRMSACSLFKTYGRHFEYLKKP